MKYVRVTAGYTWRDYKTNKETVNELNISTVLDKMQEYRRNWVQHINRMPRNGLTRIIQKRKLHSKTRKESGKTIKQTPGCVRPERVSKWPASLLANDNDEEIFSQFPGNYVVYFPRLNKSSITSLLCHQLPLFACGGNQPSGERIQKYYMNFLKDIYIYICSPTRYTMWS